MPNLLKILSSGQKKQVLTGSIENRKVNGKYQVDVDGRSLSVKSLVGDVLPKGSRVIIVKVQDELYITNKETVKDRQLLTVVVDG